MTASFLSRLAVFEQKNTELGGLSQRLAQENEGSSEIHRSGQLKSTEGTLHQSRK
jgi:hypothetical protein